MRKNKLFTLVAVISLVAVNGASLSTTNSQVTYAAKNTKKNLNKYAKVQIKYGAQAYNFKIKNNKVSSVQAYKYKNKTMRLRSMKADAIWTTKYKKTTYYFVKVGKSTIMVRAKDTRRLNKIKIPSYTTYLKNYEKERSKQMNKELSAVPRPTTYKAKTNRQATYFVENTGADKVVNPLKDSDDKLAANTELTVLYQDNYQINGQNQTLYAVQTKDKKNIFIQKNFVKLNQSKSKVLSKAQYDAAYQKWTSAISKIYAKYGLLRITNK